MRNFKIKIEYVLLTLIIASHLLLLAKIVFFPYPELFVYSYLTKQGLIPYKEILDQHFPGLMFLPVNLFSIGIDTVLESRVLHLLIVSFTHVFLFILSNKLIKSKRWILAVNILYVVAQPYLEGYVLWIDSFIPLLLLPSMYLLLDGRKNNYLVSGILLGTALIFKQVVVILIFLIIILLLLEFKRTLNKTKLMKFISGLVIPSILLVLWVWQLGIWKDFIYWTFTFNVTTFAQMGRKFATTPDIIKFVWFFGAIFIPLFFWNYRKQEKNLILLLVYFAGSLVFAYARFDFVHLQPALPFALILIIFSLQRISKRIAIFWLSIYLVLSFYFLIPFYSWANNDEVMFFGNYEKSLAEEVSKYAVKGDKVFAFGTTPHLYYLTNTLPPGNIFVFQFPWFMKIAEDRILEGIKIDPPKVIIRDANAKVEDMNLIANMPKIDIHVNKFYTVVNSIQGTDILIPNDQAVK